MGRIFRSTDLKLPDSIQKRFALVHEEIADTGMLRRRLPEGTVKTLKAFSPDEEMIIEGVANLATLDRWDEIIPADAWKKRIENYKLNPIFLREHNRDWPIGIALDLDFEKGLSYRAQIGNPKLAPLTAMQIDTRSLIAQGILRMNSVGFIPHLIEWDEDEEVVRHTDVELLEISIVSIPMHQDSGITSIKTARSKRMSDGKKKSDDTADTEPKLSEIKGMVEECITLTKGCMDGIKSLVDNQKSLTVENADLKSSNVELTKKLNDLEAQSEALLKILDDSKILG